MIPKPIQKKTREAEDFAHEVLHDADRLALRLRETLPGDQDWERTQTDLAHELLAAAARLREAGEAHQRQRHHSCWLRSKRETAARELYDLVVNVRKMLTAVVGENTTLSLTGLQGKTPRQPDRLAEDGRVIVNRLHTVPLVLPADAVLGFALDRERLATELNTRVTALEDVLEELRLSETTVYGRLKERDRELERFEEKWTGLKQVLGGLYVTAGLEALVPGRKKTGQLTRRSMRAEWPRRETASHPVSERLDKLPTTAPPEPLDTPNLPAPLHFEPEPSPRPEAVPHHSGEPGTPLRKAS